MIKSRDVKVYDWQEHVRPVLLQYLNELLVQDGIEPVRDLHGGHFLNGKWNGPGGSRDYRDYWHAYLEIWGGDLRNDSYQRVHFWHPDYDEEWDYIAERLEEWSVSHYEPTDPKWTRHLVQAMRRLVREDFPIDSVEGTEIVFWWSW
jgi:hypothetical protein